MKLSLMKNNNHLLDNGFSICEQEKVYDEQLEELFYNPRWYLDNLEYMVEYRVSWGNYRNNRPIIPRKLLKNR